MENNQTLNIKTERELTDKYDGMTSIIEAMDSFTVEANAFDPDRDVCKFYPSSAGKCSRAIVYQMLGYAREDLEPRIYRIMDNGTYMHNRIEHQFEEMGILIAPELSFKKPEWRISGRSDALVKNFKPFTPSDNIIKIEEEVYKYDENGRSIKDENGNRIVFDKKVIYEGPDNGAILVELKSASVSGFKYAPKREHVLQLHLYMYLLGLREAMLLYENKNTQELKEVPVPYDEKIAQEIISKVMYVNFFVDKAKLTPEEFKEKYSGFHDIDGNLPDNLKEELPQREHNENDRECQWCDMRKYCYPQKYTYDITDIPNNKSAK